jgi:anaphase-promoting complex subunit 1
LRFLSMPPSLPPLWPIPNAALTPHHPMHFPLSYGMHTLAEHLRLLVPRQDDLLKFVPIVCR